MFSCSVFRSNAVALRSLLHICTLDLSQRTFVYACRKLPLVTLPAYSNVQIVVPIKRQLINDVRFKTISGIQFDPRDLGVPKSHPHKKLYACRCRSKSLPPSRMRCACDIAGLAHSYEQHWSTHAGTRRTTCGSSPPCASSRLPIRTSRMCWPKVRIGGLARLLGTLATTVGRQVPSWLASQLFVLLPPTVLKYLAVAGVLTVRARTHRGRLRTDCRTTALQRLNVPCTALPCHAL